MKIQIDTQKRTIKIEEAVNFGELIEGLERLLPNGLWKEFKLEPYIITNWCNPIVIDRTLPSANPFYPWQQPIITYNSGVYNVDLL